MNEALEIVGGYGGLALTVIVLIVAIHHFATGSKRRERENRERKRRIWLRAINQAQTQEELNYLMEHPPWTQ